MARFTRRQFSFTHGEISPSVARRADMEFYYAALETCINWVPDHKGRLHRRPGTMFSNKTKDNCPAKLYPFRAGRGASYMIEATPGCFRFFFDKNPVKKDGIVLEVETPYREDDYCDLEFVQSCNKMFIVHENHAPRCLERIGECEFTLTTTQSVGPFDELNEDEDCKLCVQAGGAGSEATEGVLSIGSGGLAVGDTHTIDAGGTIVTLTIDEVLGAGDYGVTFPSQTIETGTYPCVEEDLPANPGDFVPTGEDARLAVSGACVTAMGCEPFTEDMVGQKIRVLDEIGDDADDPQNTWRCLTIVEFIDGGKVITDWAGGELPCTDLWQKELFGPGNYPETVWIHQDRVFYGNTQNCPNGVWGSTVGDFFDFTPTDEDGSVNPDNAIYTKINSGDCDEVLWMQTQGRNLLVGTTGGVHTLYGSGVNGALQPDAFGQALAQSVPVADLRPTLVGDATYFVDATRKKMYLTAYGDQYDSVVLEEATLFADHIGDCCFCKIAWDRCPFSILWCVTENGRLSSLTTNDQQRVKGWARHRLGGYWMDGACRRDPFVEDVETISSGDGEDDDVYLVVRRTINGEDVRFVEVLRDFYNCNEECGDLQEEAWYLDAALQYGIPDEEDVAQTSFQISGVHPATLGGATPPASSEGKLALRDASRWVLGDLIGNQWTPSSPNWFGKPEHGKDWLVSDDGAFTPLDLPKWECEPEYIRNGCFYRPLASLPREKCKKDDPARVHASVPVSVLKDGECPALVCFEGECLTAFVNGWDCGSVDVVDGCVALPDAAYVAIVGYPYESLARLLPFRQNLGSNDGSKAPTYTPMICFDVQCSRCLESGSGDDNSRLETHCHFEKVAEEVEDHENMPASLWVGSVETSIGVADVGSRIAWRNRSAYPSIIRNVETRIAASGGQ